MVLAKIFRHGLGGERILDSTYFVACEDPNEVKGIMRKSGCDPDRGWRTGYHYSAEVSMHQPITLKSFQNIFQEQSPKKKVVGKRK